MVNLKLGLNKDWAVAAGAAILGITGLVYLHQRFASYVPTIPGVSYGPGGVATGIYTGDRAPYTPFPIAQDIYGTARPYIDPVTGEAQSLARRGIGQVQSMWGGANVAGGIGRGSYRDAWADVYDPSKNTGSITGDHPDHRVSLA